MKKFLAVLAIAAAISACNNESDSTKTGDSIVPKVDSPAATAPAPTVNTDSLRRADSIRVADSINKAKAKK